MTDEDIKNVFAALHLETSGQRRSVLFEPAQQGPEPIIELTLTDHTSPPDPPDA